MTWVRLDEAFPRHPKVAAAGPLGIAMQVTALCYCNQYLTDGFVPRSVAKSLLDFEGLAFQRSGELIDGGFDVEWHHIVQDLVEAKLWEEVEGGYQIHDYHDYQPSRAAVMAEREQKRAAGKAGGRAAAKSRAKAERKQTASSRSSESQAESKPVSVSGSVINPPYPLQGRGLRSNGTNPRALAQRAKEQRRKEPRAIQLADGTTYEAL